MAAPIIYQAVLGRNDKNSGWTSVYYPIATSYDAAFQLADKINTQELALLLSTVTVPFIRISEVHTDGDSFTDVITTLAGTFAGVGTSGQMDSNVALPVKFEGQLQNRTTKFLRGLDSGLVIPGDPLSWKFDAATQLIVDQYCAFVKNQFGIWSRPGKRNGGVESLVPISLAQPHYIPKPYAKASIRKSGRPFGLQPGRRQVG